MFQFHRLQSTLMAILAGALISPMASVAQDSSDRDTREINAYVMTESGFAKYSQATRNMAALPNRCDEHKQEGAKSLGEMAAQLDSVPAIRTAIRSAGMTTREYAVFTWSLFQTGMAAWVVSQPGGQLPAGASMATRCASDGSMDAITGPPARKLICPCVVRHHSRRSG